MMLNLNVLRDKAYEVAKSKGWHNIEKSDSHYLCLIMSELMEAVNAHRENKLANLCNFRSFISYILREQKLYGESYKEEFISKFKEYIKDTVEDELADTCIRLLDLAGLRKIDLSDLLIKDIIDDEVIFTEFVYNMCSLLSDKSVSLKSKILISLVSVINYCYHFKIDIKYHITVKIEYNDLVISNKAY